MRTPHADGPLRARRRGGGPRAAAGRSGPGLAAVLLLLPLQRAAGQTVCSNLPELPQSCEEVRANRDCDPVMLRKEIANIASAQARQLCELSPDPENPGEYLALDTEVCAQKRATYGMPRYPLLASTRLVQTEALLCSCFGGSFQETGPFDVKPVTCNGEVGYCYLTEDGCFANRWGNTTAGSIPTAPAEQCPASVLECAYRQSQVRGLFLEAMARLDHGHFKKCAQLLSQCLFSIVSCRKEACKHSAAGEDCGVLAWCDAVEAPAGAAAPRLLSAVIGAAALFAFA